MIFLHNDNAPKIPDISSHEENGLRFYTTPEGRKLPSVTTVVGYRKPKQLKDWIEKKGLEESKRIATGQAVKNTGMHSIAEKYLGNDPNPFKGALPSSLETFKVIRVYIEKINNIHFLECPLYSYKLGLAGKSDVIADYDGVPSIIDFKGARYRRTEDMILSYFMQLTAYSLIYSEFECMPYRQIVILMASENKYPQIFIKRPEDYIAQLEDAIEYFNNDIKLKTGTII